MQNLPPQVTDINLQRNFIGRGANDLHTLIASLQKSVESLDLSCNHIRTNDTKQIVPLISETNLHCFNLKTNKISKKVLTEIQEIITAQKCVHEIEKNYAAAQKPPKVH